MRRFDFDSADAPILVKASDVHFIRQRPSVFSLLIVSLAILSACSGGGGSSGNGTVPIVRVAPSVSVSASVSSTPIATSSGDVTATPTANSGGAATATPTGSGLGKPTATPTAPPAGTPTSTATPTTPPVGTVTPTPTPPPVGTPTNSPIATPTASPKPTPTLAPTSTPTTTPTATPIAVVSFNDYTTFGYDNQRDAFNPNSVAFTPANLSRIHLAWQVAVSGGDYNTLSQPIVATEIAGHASVVYVGGGSGKIDAYDGLTGSNLWTKATGQELYSCESGYQAYFGIGGSAAYDPSSRSIYIVGNQNASNDAQASNTLFHLDGASGATLGQVNVAPAISGWPSLDFGHTSVTLSNGTAYVGTSATCDIASWRGRVAAVSVPTMTLAQTFYTVWNPPSQPWGGGGVWGWGGVSIDASGNVLFGVGNTDNGSTSHGSINAPYQAAPQEYSGLGDAMVQLSSNLSTLLAYNHPVATSQFSGNSADLDLNGTPTIFRPNGIGCDQQAAIQGKSGALYLYDTQNINGGPIRQYQLSPSSYTDGFLGSPAYSPVTGLLYANVPSSNQSLFPPGMIAINPGCGSPSVAWNSTFGPDSYDPGSTLDPGTPRSVPAVSAGGVVFVGTMCTSSGSTCAATGNSTNARRFAATQVRRPLICCAPQGTVGGAVWAIDATSGTVLNGGNPLIITSGLLRMPPTIDGNWIYVIDNNGDLYGLTIDASYPAINAKTRLPDARQLLKSNYKK